MSKLLQLCIFISCICGICFGVKCYSASSSTSSLPIATANIEEECSQGCQKKYEIKFIQGVASPATFAWGCSEQAPFPAHDIKDGDTFEISGLMEDANVNWRYQRRCYCKGDQCNGKQLDEKCNDEPKWDHECYASRVIGAENSSKMKPISSVVKATKAQPCTLSVMRFLNTTTYELAADSGPWPSKGCAHKLTGSFETMRLEKSSCCGDKCYNKGNVKLLANDSAAVARQMFNFAVVIIAVINTFAQ